MKVEIGLNEGARPVSGGRVPTDPALARGFFVEPTVFADVAPTMRILQEEVFGPFTSVTAFKDEAEAITPFDWYQDTAGQPRLN